MSLWQCENHLCAQCNIRTKGICMTPQVKLWRLEKLIMDFKKEIKESKKTLNRWQQLTNILKEVQKEMEENEKTKKLAKMD